jgi:hypothetical protein
MAWLIERPLAGRATGTSGPRAVSREAERRRGGRNDPGAALSDHVPASEASLLTPECDSATRRSALVAHRSELSARPKRRPLRFEAQAGQGSQASWARPARSGQWPLREGGEVIVEARGKPNEPLVERRLKNRP